jgi:hypothetical protein
VVRSTSSLVTHFCWVGDIDPSLKDWMANEISDAERTGTFHMAGYRQDIAALLSAADAFVLTSREDPFPSVVLEALYAGLPTIAFEDSGGIPELLRVHPLGHIVPFADTVAMAAALVSAQRKGPTAAARILGRKVIAENFDFPAYVWQLLLLVHRDLPTVSVAVPNYNYAEHMAKRLSSVFLQNQPVREILVLDDCSTDNSLEVIPLVAEEWGRHIRLLSNDKNSGSVFRQWRKAAETATGEFLWIAEADDLSTPQFLAQLISLMRHDPSIQFAFSDSSAIDAGGAPLSTSYKSYYATVAPEALLRTQIFEGKDFARRFLSIKNLILNVSAVVWRRQALLEAMSTCEADLKSYKMAGDWRLYLQALSTIDARVAYCAEPLNIHRRHARSVTHALDPDRHAAEIAACQAFAASEFELSPEILRGQISYLKELRKQFAAAPSKISTSHVSARSQKASSIRPRKRGVL